jgi:hypothetical protein
MKKQAHSERTGHSTSHSSGKIDRTLLEKLKDVEEIRVATGSKLDHKATIWIVVVNGEPFVRSFTGPKGKWYRNVQKHPEVELEFDGDRVRMRAIPVSDQHTIEAVSKAYLEKYRSSPYAKEMVRDEVLPTTLRLEPS